MVRRVQDADMTDPLPPLGPRPDRQDGGDGEERQQRFDHRRDSLCGVVAAA